MTLEERYTNSTADSYVGRVRRFQSGVGEGGELKDGVNFMDGDSRSQRADDGSYAAVKDEWQSEFTRTQKSQIFRINPDDTNNKSYPRSRWLEKSLKLAFDLVGPSKLPTGYYGHIRYKYADAVRGSISDPIHFHTPSSQFNTKLASTFSTNRATVKVGPPSPSGLNG